MGRQAPRPNSIEGSVLIDRIPPASSPLRVLVIADDPLARSSLIASLENAGGLQVIGHGNSDDDVGQLCRQTDPSVVLWDLGWGAGRESRGLDGLSALELPVVVLAADGEAASNAWAAGVRNLLPRQVEPDTLARALSAAADGLTVLDASLVGGLLPPVGPGEHDEAEPLTAREIEVLRLLAEGLPNKGIAARLGVSEHTAKFHVNAILRKLGAQSRTEAVVRATRRGLILL